MEQPDDPLLEDVCQQRRVWQLALYAAHLATGSNIMCISMKAGTITAYIKDVASFLAPYSPVDPRFRVSTDRGLAPEIKAIIDEVKRWEGQPDRREPYTPQMLRHHRQTTSGEFTSLNNALADWFTMGLYGGFRLSEWAQARGGGKIGKHHLTSQKEAYAFRFREPSGAFIQFDRAVKSPDLVYRTELTHAEQKNQNNGEIRIYVRNKTNDDQCFVAALMRVVKRFIDILGPNESLPLSVYLDSSGNPRNITSDEIEKAMRRSATAVYNLDPVLYEADILRWSAHSLRVGACVALYTCGFTTTSIKHLLRWKSDAFMGYLRNINTISEQQNTALNDVGDMPNYF